MLRPPFSILPDTNSSPSIPPTSPTMYTLTQIPNITLRNVPPAAFQNGYTLTLVKDNPDVYYSSELLTSRLNNIKNYLWLAGLPSCARPLHRQHLLGRQILITEDPNEHLIWHQTRIFLKPLPLFLFSYDCWTHILCKNIELYTASCGFLLSYAWVIRYSSDLKIAHKTGLLPEEITWTIWTDFIHDFLSHIDLQGLSDISPDSTMVSSAYHGSTKYAGLLNSVGTILLEAI